MNKKMPQLLKTLPLFERVVIDLPIFIYWKNKKGCFIGASNYALQLMGCKSVKEIIGKTSYDIWPKDIAEKCMVDDMKVINVGAMLRKEDVYIMPNGDMKYCIITKAPLHDEKNRIVGMVGSAVEIADTKKIDGLQGLHLLEKAVFCIPTFIYWKDRNGIFLGANEFTLQAFRSTGLVGKTDYDLWPEDLAKKYIADDKEVVKTGKAINKEDIYILPNGEMRHCMVTKAPLYNSYNEIIGVIGSSIDITEHKRAEKLQVERNRLNVENKAHKKLIEEQERFKKIVDQVVHDIRSPLASMSIILGSSGIAIPEKVRITLRNIAANITDIANNMLNRYAQKEFSSIGDTVVLTDEKSQTTMIYPLLLQVLSDKKYQHHKKAVKLEGNFNFEHAFIAIKIKPSDFKRMMSNLINNAVEACDKRKGTVNLVFNIKKKNIELIVQDSGKGMSKEKITKILRNAKIVSDKKGGYGIGLTQVRETLRCYQGKLAIDSRKNKGTKIVLTFPVVSTPAWVARKILLTSDDTVVILDDDSSIHGAWEARFVKYTNVFTLEHFASGNEAVEFINTFRRKDKIFLLADFELLRQGLNGIDVIERTKVKRAVIVTSHYNNMKVRNLARSAGVKILPKELAAEVKIEIKNGKKAYGKTTKYNKVDLVLIDDDELLTDSLSDYFVNLGKKVDKYYNATKFLEKLSQYGKNTIMLFDYDLRSKLTGIELAKKLHKKGYRRLYLFSGKEFNKKDIPSYLTVISKTDIDSLAKLVKK